MGQKCSEFRESDKSLKHELGTVVASWSLRVYPHRVSASAAVANAGLW